VTSAGSALAACARRARSSSTACSLTRLATSGSTVGKKNNTQGTWRGRGTRDGETSRQKDRGTEGQREIGTEERVGGAWRMRAASNEMGEFCPKPDRVRRDCEAELHSGT